jgi:uncharacterized protein (DUF433 family)
MGEAVRPCEGFAMNLPDFLTRDPDDEIHLTGHRIGLYTVVRCYREGRTAEQIAEEFPSLPLELVRQVLAFYHANRAEVDAYVDAYRADLERQEAEYVPGPGVVRIRHLTALLRQADARFGADPSWQALSLVEKLARIENEGPAGAP